MTDWNAIVKAELEKQGQAAQGPSMPPLTNSVFTDVEEGGESPDFMTQVRLGLVSDPQLAMKIAAQSRFPDLPDEERGARYGVHKEELVYQGDDGKLHYETPDNWWSRFKRFGIRSMTDPTVLGGTAGAIAGGWPGAAAGAAGGEVWKKNIQASMGQKDAPILGDVADTALAGVEAAVGERAGQGLTALMNRIGAKRGGVLAAAAGRDRSKIDVAEVSRLEALGQQYGVDLYPPSTTGSKRLADKWKLLADLPDTADPIQAALKKTTEQVENAFYRQLDNLAPPTSSLESGTALVNRSRQAIDTVVNQRRQAARPLYKKAFETNPDVDIEPMVAWLDKGLGSSKGDVIKAYGDVKNILMRPDLPKKTPAQASKILNPDGTPAFTTPEIVNYETKLKGLHDSLTALSQKVETNKNNLGKLTPVGLVYDRARRGLRKMLRDADGNYAAAMDLYREGSDFVEEVADSTLIGAISKLKGDKRIHAAQRLFASSDSDPVTVARARSVLVDALGFGDDWNKALRFEMQRQFDRLTKTLASSNVQNLGGMTAKMMGNKRNMQIFEAAMTPQQFATWKDFFEVLDRSKLIFGKESMTTPRQIINQELQKEGGSTVLTIGETATSPTELVNVLSKIFKKGNEVLRGRYNKELTESLLSEQAHQQLLRMKQLPAGSDELAGAVMAFLATVAGGEGERRFSQALKSDSLPQSMQPTLQDLSRRR